MFTDKISVTALVKTETWIVSVFARAVIELKVPVLFETDVKVESLSPCGLISFLRMLQVTHKDFMHF